MRDLEKQLKALANSRRLKILKYLERVNKVPVGSIAKEIGLSFKSTSKHLAILRAVEMVTTAQEGIMVFYSLSGAKTTILKQVLEQC